MSAAVSKAVDAVAIAEAEQRKAIHPAASVWVSASASRMRASASARLTRTCLSAIRPIVLGMQTLRVDLPAMAIASVAVLVLSLDGVLSVVDGAILLAMAIGYTVLLIRAARREAEPVVAEFAAEYPAEAPESQRGFPILGVG